MLPTAICGRHLDHVFGLTHSNSLPVFVSPELGEREPIRHLHSVLVLRGNGLAAQDGRHYRRDHHQPGCNFRHAHASAVLEVKLFKRCLHGARRARLNSPQAERIHANNVAGGSLRSIDSKAQDKQDHENNKECVEQCPRNVSKYAGSVRDAR